MLQNKKTNLFYALTVISLSTLIVVSVVYAWTEPPLAPPGGNVPTPLNVGLTTQYKAGALGIGGVFWAFSDAIFDRNVGIGTTTSTEKLIVQSVSDGRGVISINQVGIDNWSGLKIDRDGLEKWFIGVSAANDNLRLRRNSASDDLVIDSSGNVGIGTTTPAYKLDVAGRIRSSLGGFIFPDNTIQSSAAGVSFWAASSTNIYNTNNDNVGIGTTVPAYTLDVYGTLRAATSTFGVINAGTWQGTPVAYNYGGTGTSTALALQNLWWGDGTGKLVQVASSTLAGGGGTPGGATTQIQFNNAGAFGGDANLTWATSTQLLTVTGISTFSGNVSIGTTTSTEKLIVQSVSDGRGVISINQVGIDNWSGLKIDRDGLEKWFIGVSAANDNLRLRRGSASDDLVIDSSGNIGVGTTTPAYNLDVYGTLRAQNYYSADGTIGWTGTCLAASSTVVKNGLVVGCQ